MAVDLTAEHAERAEAGFHRAGGGARLALRRGEYQVAQGRLDRKGQNSFSDRKEACWTTRGRAAGLFGELHRRNLAGYNRQPLVGLVLTGEL